MSARHGFDYQSCYCEENIWKLIQRLQNDNQISDAFVVFISNSNKTIPIFQKDGTHIIWDYHVIAVCRLNGEWFVYDFDATQLQFPCHFDEYVKYSFQPGVKLKPIFQRKFRIINSTTYLTSFSSDRSHMLLPDNTYAAEPPSWPCIQVDSIKTNLFSHFIDMEANSFGNVKDEENFIKTFNG